MTATTFGRPVTLSRFWNIKPPQAIDDEFLQHVGEGCQPPGLHSKMDGFVYSISLFDILDHVLSTIYSSSDDKIEHPPQENPHLAFTKRLASTFTLNSQLDDLLKNIPTHLKLQGNFTNNAGQMKRCFQIQEKTLNCRFIAFPARINIYNLTNTLGSCMSDSLSLDLGFSKGSTLQGGILFHLEQ